MGDRCLADTSTNDFHLKDIVCGENVAEVHFKQIRQNIVDADATVLYCDPESLDYRNTVEYCLQVNKPYLLNPNADDLSAFIQDNYIRTLNVIGTRGSKLIPKFLYAHRTSFREALLPFAEKNS